MFRINIPETEASAGPIVERGEALPAGTEKILFIDDEQVLVELGTEILMRLGYGVTSVTDSVHALEIFRSRPVEFDLVITDYTMPKLTGADLCEEFHQIRPNIPIIVCTGFSEKITETTASDLGVELIMKPFGLKQLAGLVRMVLDGKRSG
jgi:CheY-like chemotaxis protein